MINRGFEEVEQTNVPDAETFKREREAELKKWAHTISDLKDQVRALENRKKNIEDELTAAYVGRQKELDAEAVSQVAHGEELSALSRDLSQREKDLAKAQADFEAYKADEEAVLQRARIKNQSDLELVNEKLADVAVREQKLVDDRNLLDAQQQALDSAWAEFENEQITFEPKRQKVADDLARIEAVNQDIKDRQTQLSIQSSHVAEQIKELNEAAAKYTAAGEDSRKLAAEAKIQAQEARDKQAELKTIQDEQKQERESLNALRTKLDIQRKVDQSEAETRKRDLDAREANIKKLEANTLKGAN